MVTPAGFEPAIAGLRTRSPGPLDEGAITMQNLMLPHLLACVHNCICPIAYKRTRTDNVYWMTITKI